MNKEIFSVNNQKIDANLFYPETRRKKMPAVLFVHGWNSNQEKGFARAEDLTKLGVIGMTFDLRSHGKSEGERDVLSRDDYLRDVTAAYDFLKSQDGVDDKRIGVMGTSFGGYLSAIMTSKRDVRWLALRAPSNYPNEGFGIPQVKFMEPVEERLRWRMQKRHYSETISLEAVHNFSNDILTLESEYDEMVPKQTIMNYIDAVTDRTKHTHVIIEGATHSLTNPKWQEQYGEFLTSWFKEKIS